MIFRSCLLSLLLIASNFNANTQDHSVQFINWKKLGGFPAKNGIPSIGLAGQTAGVNGDYMIVAGGSNFPEKFPWEGGKKKYYDDVLLFRKKSNGMLKFLHAYKLPMNLGYAATASTEKGLVVAGGENETGILDKVMIIRVINGYSEIAFLPDIPMRLTNAIAVAYKSRVYLVGGETAAHVSDKVFVLDLDSIKIGWKSFPSIPRPVSHAVGVFIDQDHAKGIYVFGGRSKQPNGISDLYSSSYYFDVQQEKWVEKKGLPYTLSAGTGLATTVGKVFLFGGDKGETFHQVETIIAEKARETKPVLIEMLDKKRIELQSNHPGFSNEILCYDIILDSWSSAGKLPFAAPVTTHAFLWDNRIFIPGGEIRAGVRTADIFSAEVLKK